MADKIYQLPYDDVIDEDISSWLNSLPRSRKAEIVRNAIRYYLQGAHGNAVITTVNTSLVNQIEQVQQKKEPKRRPTGLPKDGSF